MTPGCARSSACELPTRCPARAASPRTVARAHLHRHGGARSCRSAAYREGIDHPAPHRRGQGAVRPAWIRTGTSASGSAGIESLVRAVGVEPTLCCQKRILSPSRLPIPPRPRSRRPGVAPGRRGGNLEQNPAVGNHTIRTRCVSRTGAARVPAALRRARPPAPGHSAAAAPAGPATSFVSNSAGPVISRISTSSECAISRCFTSRGW